MRIPKGILNKMVRASELSERAVEIMEKVDEYMDKHGELDEDLPAGIQNKRQRADALSEKANELMNEVDEYLESQGVDIDRCYYGGRISIGNILYGEDVTTSFVKWAETDFSDD